MVEKLKLITKQIPWSLLLKPIVLGGAWFVAPLWVALVSAVLLYSVPFFTTGGTLLQFVVMLALMAALPHTIINVIGIGIMFALIIGIQELIFAYRLRAYEVITVMVLFLAGFAFFSHATNAALQIPLIPLFSIICLFFLLFRDTLRRYLVTADASDTNHAGFLAGLSTLFLLESTVILLLLPLTMFAETAILLLLGTVLLDQASDYLRGSITSARTVFAAILFLGVLGGVLIFIPWHP
jgi:hypothetical protein